MSGIAAIIRSDGTAPSPEALSRMAGAMAYRGTDGITSWSKGPVALTHCSMHASAEDLPARQPLASADGQIVITFDGYLANRDDLILALRQRGSNPQGGSDAELVLQAWEAWGEKCPEHFDGEFAFVLWDGRRSIAFAARDHIGLRPLHYSWDGTTLAVASDIGGIVAGRDRPPSLNRGYLAEVASAFYLTNDLTPWNEVLRLPAAHRLILDRGRLRIDQYWQVPREVTIRYRRDEDYVEQYREILTESVRRAARTHLPLAFEVSGGLDSTAVFAMADRLRQEGQLSAPAMQGYTFAPPPGSAADELSYVAAFEDRLGISLKRVPMFMPDIAWFEERARQDRDLALFCNSAMFEGIRRQMVADGSRVLLNGQGGDNWLDGTMYYYADLISAGEIGRLGRTFLSERDSVGTMGALRDVVNYGVKPLVPRRARSLLGKLRGKRNRMVDPAKFYWLADDLQDLLAQRMIDAAANHDRSYENYKATKAHDPVFGRILDTVARQQAQAGCESRSPMLSRLFIEFSARTPEYIRRRGTTKWVHRQAMRPYLPQCIIDRQDKAEFSVSYSHHLPALEQLFCATLPADPLGIFQPDKTCAFFRRYCSAAIDGTTIWQLWGSYVVARMAAAVLRV